MTYRELLKLASSQFQKSGTPFLDALLLLSEALHLPKEKLLANLSEQAPLIPPVFLDMVQRRIKGESIAHILGYKEFFGRKFYVTNDVLSPRPETEILVEAALYKGDILQTKMNERQLSVLDLCTGSGAIAISIAAERPQWRISASDVSASALQVAEKNAENILGPKHSINFILSDLFNTLNNSYHIITSNPPYVPTQQALELIQNGMTDPLLSLDGGEEGLDLLQRIVLTAPKHLLPGGWLFLEMDPSQINSVWSIMKDEGFYDIVVYKDLAGRNRVLGGQYG